MTREQIREKCEKLLMHFTSHGCHHKCDITREDVRAAFHEIRNEALEEAAKECDKIASNTADFDRFHRKASGQCAFIIRALKDVLTNSPKPKG